MVIPADLSYRRFAIPSEIEMQQSAGEERNCLNLSWKLLLN
jgi:hypothetical protein